MTKLKTRRAAAKRFSFTGTGKIKRRVAAHRHNMTTQPKKAKRVGRKGAIATPGDSVLIRVMLPYGG